MSAAARRRLLAPLCVVVDSRDDGSAFELLVQWGAIGALGEARSACAVSGLRLWQQILSWARRGHRGADARQLDALMQLSEALQECLEAAAPQPDSLAILSLGRRLLAICAKVGRLSSAEADSATAALLAVLDEEVAAGAGASGAGTAGGPGEAGAGADPPRDAEAWVRANRPAPSIALGGLWEGAELHGSFWQRDMGRYACAAPPAASGPATTASRLCSHHHRLLRLHRHPPRSATLAAGALGLGWCYCDALTGTPPLLNVLTICYPGLDGRRP